MKTLTYVDSGVLLEAFRGVEPYSERALAILADPQRVFASSVFVEMELTPKALYYNRFREIRFYETFFASVALWANFDETLLQEGLREARIHGLGAIDALHIVAASSVGAAELVTTEKKSRPIHRTGRVTVVSLYE